MKQPYLIRCSCCSCTLSMSYHKQLHAQFCCLCLHSMELLLNHIRGKKQINYFINDQHENVHYYSIESKRIRDAVFDYVYRENDYWKKTQLNKNKA